MITKCTFPIDQRKMPDSAVGPSVRVMVRVEVRRAATGCGPSMACSGLNECPREIAAVDNAQVAGVIAV